MSNATSPTRRQHLEALGLALLCAVLFLRESLLPGRALVPHPPELLDVPMLQAIADGSFDANDACRGNVGMTDKYLQSLCWDRVIQDRLQHGEIPRWTDDIGGGAPFVPQMAQPYQPINLLLLLLPSEQWYGWWFLLHQVLFGWFAYIFLRRLGCAHGPSLLALVAAVLGLWTQCKLHHNVILTAALSLWPMLTATYDLVADGVVGSARRRAIAWLGLWTGLSWSSGFVVVSLQATYLTLGFSLLLASSAPRGERLRRLLPVAIGLGLGGMLSLANMLPVLLASAQSARAGTFDDGRLAALGLEWDHALGLCWPDLLSWPADHFYLPTDGRPPFEYATHMPWSELVLLNHPLRPEDHSAFQNWVETSCAIGLVPLAASTLALLDPARRRLVWFFVAIAGFAFGCATAKQPFLTLAHLLPGVTAGDLRRLLFLVAMPLVVLSGLGADAFVRSVRRWPAFLLLGAVAVMSLLAIGWLAKNHDDAAFVRATATLYVADHDDPVVRDQLHGSVDEAVAATVAASLPGEAGYNHTMLATTAWRALLVALLAMLALRLPWRWRTASWLALTMLELLHAGLGPMLTVPAAHVKQPPKVLQPVLDAAEPNGVRPRLQRLVVDDHRHATGALPANLPGFYGAEDGSAYNPLPPARFEEFSNAIEPGIGYGGAGVGCFHEAASLQHPLCDLFGLRFILTRAPLEPGPGLVDRTPPGTGGYRLLERTTTLPRATFVQQVDLIADKTARLAALRRPDRDVRHRVVLEDIDAKRPDDSTPANTSIDIREHRDERVLVHVTTDRDGYLRLADPYDPGWRATLDGDSTTIYIADHYLRAVFVPKGEHDVVFTYDGARVVWPARCSLVALAAILALALWRRKA